MEPDTEKYPKQAYIVFNFFSNTIVNINHAQPAI